MKILIMRLAVLPEFFKLFQMFAGGDLNSLSLEIVFLLVDQLLNTGEACTKHIVITVAIA